MKNRNLHSKSFSKTLNNQKGIAAISMAVIASILVGLIAITIPQLNRQSITARRDYRRMLMFQSLLTQAGQIAYTAYNTYTKHGNTCPTDTTLFTFDGTDTCFPDAGSCMTHPRLPNPVCIDTDTLSAQNQNPNSESPETIISFQLKYDENLLEKLQRKTSNSAIAAVGWLQQTGQEILPIASAFNTNFGAPPIPPTTEVATQITVPECPAGAPCFKCNDSGLKCIKVQICDPDLTCTLNSHYYSQRIVIYGLP